MIVTSKTSGFTYISAVRYDVVPSCVFSYPYCDLSLVF